MPQTQSAVRGVYDFAAPATPAAALGFRVRTGRGGKVQLRFENPITDTGAPNSTFNQAEVNDLTVSVQVAPMLADGTPGVFVPTTSADNLEAVVGEVIGAGQNMDYTLLLRPGIDVFVAIRAEGATRGHLIVTGDDVWDLYRTADGLPVFQTV